LEAYAHPAGFEKYPFFTDYEDLSCAEDIFYRGICMPSDTKMTDMDLKRVVDLVIELFERQSNADAI
jgi:dTDP-4-amino-4,6-dideoxygalactose transaminase